MHCHPLLCTLEKVIAVFGNKFRTRDNMENSFIVFNLEINNILKRFKRKYWQCNSSPGYESLLLHSFEEISLVSDICIFDFRYKIPFLSHETTYVESFCCHYAEPVAALQHFRSALVSVSSD